MEERGAGEGSVFERIGAFFVSQHPVQDTLRRVGENCEREGIPYAVVGGMALAAHGFVRVTEDVDLLMTSEALQRFRERLVGRGYTPAFQGARKSFLDSENRVRVEILTSGEFPGDGKPKPVSFPDPSEASLVLDGQRVLTLEMLIQLKLASGLSAAHRMRDLADVQDLIRVKRLPRELADRLDESVRAEYLRLWESVQGVDDGPA